MRILVTGGTGFIGSHLVEDLLENGKFKTRCLVRTGSKLTQVGDMEIFYGDINSPKIVENALKNVDIVVHLAAAKNHFIPNAEMYKTNVTGTKTLLDCSRRIKHFIFISTILANNPTDFYSKTKREAEILVEHSGLNFTILRLPFIFGKGDKTNLTKMLNFLNKSPIVPIIGSGEQLIYPVHVDDVVEIIEDMIVKNKKGKFIIYKNVMTVNEFIDVAIKTLKLKRLKLHLPIIFVKILLKLLSYISKKPFMTYNQLLNLEREISFEEIKVFKHKYLQLPDAIKRTVCE